MGNRRRLFMFMPKLIDHLVRLVANRIARTAVSIAFATILASNTGIARADAQLRGDLLGSVQTYTAKHEDTLLDLARDNELGFVEIVAANQGTDPWIPGDGTEIVLPTGHLLPDAPREGVIINLAEHRLYFFAEDGIQTYAIGVGRDGWDTPLGTTKITRKTKDPIWYPPKSIREKHPHLPKVVRAGPNNPLGQHALYFDWPTYLVHGTNMPWGVGRRVSHGCIRLYPESIEKLFGEVPLGTTVQVINQPIKIGRSGGELYMDVHPEPEQVDDLERDGRILSAAKRSNNDPIYKLRNLAGDELSRLNWPAIRNALLERTGSPVRVTP